MTISKLEDTHHEVEVYIGRMTVAAKLSVVLLSIGSNFGRTYPARPFHLDGLMPLMAISITYGADFCIFFGGRAATHLNSKT